MLNKIVSAYFILALTLIGCAGKEDSFAPLLGMEFWKKVVCFQTYDDHYHPQVICTETTNDFPVGEYQCRAGAWTKTANQTWETIQKCQARTRADNASSIASLLSARPDQPISEEPTDAEDGEEYIDADGNGAACKAIKMGNTTEIYCTNWSANDKFKPVPQK